jgi:catechol-2,3-dioxygenase
MRITSLEIQSSHLAATRKFYLEVLGLTGAETTGGKLSIQLPDATLTFCPATSPAPKYHIAFTVPYNQLTAALTWLRPGTEVMPINEKKFIADFKNWNAQAVYFFDNNGNILELIGRRDLNNASSKPFGADSILGVSEVGIVTNSVRDTCSALIQSYGLDYFSRQKPSEHFAAVGDDEGLFIVVSKDRHWYPTEIPSTVHPLKINFMVNETEHHFEWPID